jgi:transcriptional regulator with XRE-family HTH domain
MDQKALIAHVRRMPGTQRQIATKLGVSEAYLSDFLAEKREAGPKLLQALGMVRVVTFKRGKA